MKVIIPLSAIFTATLLAGVTIASAQETGVPDAAAGAPADAAASAPANAAAAAQANAADSTDSTELAKKLSNPIADLVSMPFQFNWENGIGPLDLTRYILNIQPVVPFHLNKSTNMIVRIIAPIVSQPPPVTGGLPSSGVSDVLTSFFFSPTKGSIIWGVGPIVSVPSTSIPTLGTEKWSAGPTAVVLKQHGGLTVGTLINQVWSFAGNVDREDVSQMFVEPFLAYTNKKAVTFTLQSESTRYWKVEGDGEWNVPINLEVAKLLSFGTFPASYQLGWGYFVVHPDNGATWKIRGAITLLLPEKKK
jgi:hypothetical protein